MIARFPALIPVECSVFDIELMVLRSPKEHREVVRWQKYW